MDLEIIRQIDLLDGFIEAEILTDQILLCSNIIRWSIIILKSPNHPSTCLLAGLENNDAAIDSSSSLPSFATTLSTVFHTLDCCRWPG